MAKNDGGAAFPQAELVSARDRIKQLESRLSIEVDGTVHHDGCLKEIERLTAEVERLKQELTDEYSADKDIQERFSKIEIENEKLDAELTKYKLKWEPEGKSNLQGLYRPPQGKTGWYWVRNADGLQIIHLGGTLSDYRTIMTKWAGPITEPEGANSNQTTKKRDPFDDGLCGEKGPNVGDFPQTCRCLRGHSGGHSGGPDGSTWGEEEV